MPIKYDRAWAMAAAKGVHTGPTTMAHILANITSSVPAEVLDTMSSKQIAALICAADKSYKDGLARAAAEQ